MERDSRDLRWLAIAHYVLGGLIGLISLVFLIAMLPSCAVGLFPQSHCTGSGRCPPQFFGLFYNIIGLVAVLGGLGFGALLAMTGRYLIRRLNYQLCVIMAGFQILLLPFNTILGIFTLAVLMRDSVKESFARKAMAAPTPNAQDIDPSQVRWR